MSTIKERHAVICGGGNVGKSSLVLRLTKNKFIEEYDPTIEYVNYDIFSLPPLIYGTIFDVSKTPYADSCNFVLDDDATIKLSISDTAGQRTYRELRNEHLLSVLLKNGGFLLVYSITDGESFDEISKIYKRITSFPQVTNPKEIPMIVIGNKTDLESDRKISKEKGKELEQKFGNNTKFYETSAKLEENSAYIKEIFKSLAKMIHTSEVVIDKDRKKASNDSNTEETSVLESNTDDDKQKCCVIL